MQVHQASHQCQANAQAATPAVPGQTMERWVEFLQGGQVAQVLSFRVGKQGYILRINADGTIPADNPFLGQTTGVNQANSYKNDFVAAGVHPRRGFWLTPARP